MRYLEAGMTEVGNTLGVHAFNSLEGMTLAEAKFLPEKDIPESTYEHFSKSFTCPVKGCGEALLIEKASYGPVCLETREQEILVYEAGCHNCGILYKFHDELLKIKRIV